MSRRQGSGRRAAHARVRPARPTLRVMVALAAAGAVAACGGTGEESDQPAEGSDAEVRARVLEAVGPWVRTAIVPEATGPDAPPVNTAAYFVLQNPTDTADALVFVETAIADTAELHSVSMDDGVMRMRAVDSVAVPAMGEAALEPGGYHVMLIGITGPLAEGDTVPLRLRLRSGRVLDVAAPVLRSPPM